MKTGQGSDTEYGSAHLRQSGRAMQEGMQLPVTLSVRHD